MSNTNGGLEKSEYERMWRVIDLSLTAHSLLRDKYRRLAVLFSLSVMSLSVVVSALAFVPSSGLEARIGSWRLEVTNWTGTLGILIFMVSLADLLFDWKRESWVHAEAAERLALLKGRFRAVSIEGSNVESGGVDLRAEYEQTMAAVVEIPEGKFLGAKVKHRRKIAVSKLIDSHPGAPLFYLKSLATVKGLRENKPPPVKSGPDEAVEEPPTQDD